MNKPTEVVGRRVVAWILDALLLVAVDFGLFFALAGDPVKGLASGDLQPNDQVYGNLTIGDTTYSVFGGKAVLWALVFWAFLLGYFVVWQGLKGVTLGKLALGIKVVKDDGSGPPGIARSLGRFVLGIVDGFPYIIPNLVGFICAMASERNQRVGDMACSTVVVRRDASVTAVGTPPPPAPPPPGIPFQNQ